MEYTTELSAINSMLATVGEAPLSTLEDLGVADAITAKSALAEVTREVLVQGWHFNTDQNFPIMPEGFAPFEAMVPPNALEAVPNDGNLVVRGRKLYDRSSFSSSFPDGKAILCQIIWNLSFDDLPETTRQYVFLRAARRFQKRALASDLIHAITESDEREAMWVHRKANIRVRKKNYLFDSRSVRDIHQNR